MAALGNNRILPAREAPPRRYTEGGFHSLRLCYGPGHRPWRGCSAPMTSATILAHRRRKCSLPCPTRDGVVSCAQAIIRGDRGAACLSSTIRKTGPGTSEARRRNPWFIVTKAASRQIDDWLRYFVSASCITGVRGAYLLGSSHRHSPDQPGSRDQIHALVGKNAVAR